MKVAVLVFSPSGHTLKVAQMISNQCIINKAEVNLINITKDNDLLFSKNKEKNLKNMLGSYDLLFVGAPIYAGHFESYMKCLIPLLPSPDLDHKNLAIPFVTYGGAHSSVALEEAGKLLHEKGYKIVMGLKIAAKHTLTVNCDVTVLSNSPGLKEQELINIAIEKVFKLLKDDSIEIKDSIKEMKYTPLFERLLFKKLTQEKLHDKFKTVKIIDDKCINCRKCIQVCPVNNFKLVDKTVHMIDTNNNCILCGECNYNCPKHAIEFEYEEMAKKRLKNGHYELEKELNAIYTAN